MFMAQPFGCQASKLCSDTCSAVHRDLPRVTRERGGSDGDTWVGELPSQPQTHCNFPGEDHSERTKPMEMVFQSGAHGRIPSPPAVVGCAVQSCRSQPLVLPAGQGKLQPQPSLCSCPRYSCVPFKEPRCAREQKVPEPPGALPP